jgi:hypothetical protein
MKKLFIAKGYNSFTNKQLTQAFATEKEADSFLAGLTDPHIHIVAYKSTLELINHFLKA